MRMLLMCLICSFALSGQTTFSDSVWSHYSDFDEAERLKEIHEVAHSHYDVNLAESEELILSIIDYSRMRGNRKYLVLGLELLGDIRVSRGIVEGADTIFEEAIPIAKQLDDYKSIIGLLIGKIRLYNATGRNDEAFPLIDEAIRISSEHKDSLQIARCYMTRGTLYNTDSKYDLAIQDYYIARDYFRALGDEFRVGMTETNIGMVFLDSRSFPQAQHHFEEALRISEKTDDLEGVMVNLLNLGVTAQKQGQFDKANEYYLKSLGMAKSMGDVISMIILNDDIGTTAMALGKYNLARTHLLRAVHIADSVNSTFKLAHALNSLTDVYVQLKDYSQALAVVDRSEQVSRDNNDHDQRAYSYKLRSIILDSLGDYKSALKYYIKYASLNDSIFNKESDARLQELQVQYETAHKESEINRLAAENFQKGRTQIIYLSMAILILVASISFIYALVTRRNKDKALLAKEHELYERQKRFFANISHEFRTPLTLITGPVENLRKANKNPKDLKLLDIIKKNSERLLFLINQILDLTKFDKNLFKLELTVFDASMLITGISSAFDSMAEDRNINYAYQISSEPVLIEADQRRIETVIINLISNAFKFTPDAGSIKVFTAVDSEKNLLIVKVKDNGPGIPEEHLEKIFERHFHDDKNSYADFAGVGIGLALSKHIIELHNGNIGVKSEKDQGSTFIIKLPYNPEIQQIESVVKTTPETMVDSLSKVHEFPLGDNDQNDKPMLLIVEDNRDMREYIKSFLSPNFEIIEAPNAVEGLDLALEQVPDIIISDVMMPMKSGLEFCGEVKSDVRLSHIPVMLLTAKSTVEDRISGLGTEADIYLTKPFHPKELQLHLKNLLSSRKKIISYFTKNRLIEPSKMAFNSLDEKFLTDLNNLLEAHHVDENFSVEQLADLMNLSRSQLHRKLKALTGQSPNVLIRTFRLKRAHDMLCSDVASVSEIAYQVGFNSPAYFTKCFHEEFGLNPTELKKA